jgi:hypothetical protein
VSGDHAFVADEDFSGLQVIQVFESRFDNTDDNIGQSLTVNPSADTVKVVRLTTPQTESINWEITADGGLNWEPITPDGTWTELMSNGNDLRWRSTHTQSSYFINPTCSELTLDWGGNPWINLGHGLAGTYGLPTLTASAYLIGGWPISISLTGALENTTAYLVVGLSRIDYPYFYGGTMVPSVDSFYPIPTGSGGSFDMNGTWSTGIPMGTSIYLQTWIIDPGAIMGYAASNALEGTAN